MYKLTYFKATNVIGFMSGLGKKTFELNLEKLKDKDIITIIGNNATGKSTFASLIHPWHLPSDKRSKFIQPNKEGTIVREYTGDDGTCIITRIVYTPKGDDSHSAKCYLKLIRPDGDEQEMNPSGNVTSYYSLAHTYFGITKDYINFASYSEAVNNIVKMTDTERKLNVTNLIPNTNRFEMAYNTINDKYKELRNLIRNVSQKILYLRDEDTLRGELKRTEKDLKRFSEDREDAMKKIAKMEGRIKELAGKNDVNDLLEKYNEDVSKLMRLDGQLNKYTRELLALYKLLHIDTLDDNTIMFDGINDVATNISRFERKVDRAEQSLIQYKSRMVKVRELLDDVENELISYESVLYSLQTHDLDDLEKLLDNYKTQLNSLEYTKNRKKYDNMNYDEAVNFVETLDMMDRIIDTLCDTYGQLFSDYFDPAEREKFSTVSADIEGITHEINNTKGQMDFYYRQIVEREQYRKLQDILDKRPATCHDDTCPFIANALQWSNIQKELEQRYLKHNECEEHLKVLQKKHENLSSIYNLNNDIKTLLNIMERSGPSFTKYLGVTLNDVTKSFQNGTWHDTLNIDAVKKVAVVLSEKDLYNRIVTVKIPEIEHNMELAKTSETSRKLTESSCKRLRDTRAMYTTELDELNIHIVTNTVMLSEYKTRLESWKRVQELLGEYKDNLETQERLTESSSSTQDLIRTIKELQDKIGSCKSDMKDLDEVLRELMPRRDQLRYDLIQLDQLKLEKAAIETDFLIVDVMKSIIQPGKGVWKEAINIYMYDIHNIANQLLLNTFDGNLYLKEFIITDKSFIIPYVYNGSEGSDISYASSSQQSTICTALSLAIVSKLIDKYGILTYDEVDAPLSPANKELFVDILTQQMRYIGINQSFIITHSPEFYEAHDVGYVLFPGSVMNKKGKDLIEIK